MQEQAETSTFRNVNLKLEENEQHYGFHLIRTKWDPFPRIEKVDENSIANKNAIISGDFLIEINTQNLLGINIESIIKIVKNSSSEINLKLWNPGLEHPFIDIMNSIVSLLACPICTSIIAKRPRQCRNGHLICTDCVVRTVKCPICRAPLRRPPNNAKALPGARCLVAEQLTSLFQNSGLVSYRTADGRIIRESNENLEPVDDNNGIPATRAVKRRSSFKTKLASLWREVLP